MDKSAFMSGFYSTFEKDAGMFGDLLRSAQAAHRTQKRVSKVTGKIKDIGSRIGRKVGPPAATIGKAVEKGSISAEKGLGRVSKLSGGSGELLSGIRKVLPPHIYSIIAANAPKNLDNLLKQMGTGAGEGAEGIAKARGGVKKMISTLRGQKA